MQRRENFLLSLLLLDIWKSRRRAAEGGGSKMSRLQLYSYRKTQLYAFVDQYKESRSHAMTSGQCSSMYPAYRGVVYNTPLPPLSGPSRQESSSYLHDQTPPRIPTKCKIPAVQILNHATCCECSDISADISNSYYLRAAQTFQFQWHRTSDAISWRT